MTHTQRSSRQSLMTGLVLREPRISDIRTLYHSFRRLRVPKPLTAYFDTLHLDVRCDSSPQIAYRVKLFGQRGCVACNPRRHSMCTMSKMNPIKLQNAPKAQRRQM